MHMCSLCQQGKDDILHMFEEFSSINILKRTMLGYDRVVFRAFIINIEERKSLFIEKTLDLRKNIRYADTPTNIM